MAATSHSARLQSVVFDEWAENLAQSLGNHRSTLLTPEIPFSSCLRISQVQQATVVAIEGTSSVRLEREQPSDRAVLWLPRQGWVKERLNGRSVLAEPGSVMLCLPGDELVGESSPSLKGVSVVLPASLLGEPSGWRRFQPRHLREGTEVVALLHSTLDLVASLGQANTDPSFLLAAVVDQLLFCRDLLGDVSRTSLGDADDRRRLIASARDWIEAHLDQPFRVTDLAGALYVSTRSLQMSFREQLGHSPLEETRRLRFRRLRQYLLTTPAAQTSIENLLRRCGLTGSALTHRQYLEWSGETPHQCRARALSR